MSQATDDHNRLSRRVVLAGTSTAIVAAGVASVPAVANDDDAALLALKAERDEYVVWSRQDARANDYDDAEAARRGDHLTALERRVMRTPATTIRGISAKLDLLFEYTNAGPRDADDATLYGGIDDDGFELDLASHAADSLWADLRRLSDGEA